MHCQRARVEQTTPSTSDVQAVPPTIMTGVVPGTPTLPHSTFFSPQPPTHASAAPEQQASACATAATACAPAATASSALGEGTAPTSSPSPMYSYNYSLLSQENLDLEAMQQALEATAAAVGMRLS